MKTLILGRTEMIEDNLAAVIDDADLICNCTPLGMTKGLTPVPKRLLRKEMVIFDAVYRNGTTDLIRDARRLVAERSMVLVCSSTKEQARSRSGQE